MARTPKVEVAPRPERNIVEDVTATEIPGASPDSVYAELAQAAEQANSAPPVLAPVEVMESAHVPASADLGTDVLSKNGGQIGDNGNTITFGDKVFFADAEKRKTVPRTMNLAAGPRIIKMPEPGVFLAATKSFRSVPYRLVDGAIRVDH